MLYDELKNVKTNSKYISRYIVPFRFSPNSSIEEYNRIFNCIDPQFAFTLCDEVMDRDADVYEYLYNLYDNKGGIKEESIGSVWKYKHPEYAELKDKNRQIIQRKIYYTYTEREKNTDKEVVKLYARVSDAGMYLLKTGIGLFWYEVRYYKTESLMRRIEEVEQLIKDIKQDSDVDPTYKELKITTSVSLVNGFAATENLRVCLKKLVKEKEEHKEYYDRIEKFIKQRKDWDEPDFKEIEDITNKLQEEKEVEVTEEKNKLFHLIKKRKLEIIRKVLLGLERDNAMDIKTILDFQNKFKELARPHYEIQYRVDEKDEDAQNEFKESAKPRYEIQYGMDEKDKEAKMCLTGKWVADVIKKLNCEFIEYFPGRFVDEDGTTYDLRRVAEAKLNLVDKEKCGLLPDKAILFNYVTFHESVLTKNVSEVSTKDVLETIAYYMALGYDGKYKMDEHMKETMLHPYDNIVEFVKKEGFAECAIFTEDNKGFFIGRKMQNLRTDYFHMYMNLLQQSYSVLNMSKELAMSLPANHEAYQKNNKEISNKLEEMVTRINLFLIKSVKASVSHVENQNEFYSYIEKGLHIREDIAALRDGVGTMEEIMRRRESAIQDKNNERMQTALALLTIFGILEMPKILREFFKMEAVVEESMREPIQVGWVEWLAIRAEDPVIYGVTVIVFVFVFASSAKVLWEWISGIFISFWRWVKECWLKLNK